MELEKISCMTKTMASELRKNGISSVEALTTRSLSELKEMIEKAWIINVEFDQLKKAYEEALRLKGLWFTTADQIEAVRGKKLVFSTGSAAVDKMLGGGIFSREATEFCGDYGSGKTTFLFTILVEALGKNKEYTAVFIDTEDTFDERRVSQIAKERGYDPQDILKRTIHFPITDSDFMLEIVDRMHLTIEAKNVKLILIDSIIAVLRAEYVGRDILWYRQQLLNKMLRRLLNYAKVYNIAVVVSNQVVTNPQAQFIYDPIQQKVPTGGTVLGHNANTRLYLRRAKGSKRIVRLFDSNRLPEAECTIKITHRGVEDVAPGEEE
ncbi:MAG: ATPase domain-containing protein [Candidatus Bathyarchaeia archaeon]